MRTKKILSLLLAISMLASMSVTAFASQGANLDADTTVPVELNVSAVTFSVTIPSVLPVIVDTDGAVEVATNTKIINNSQAKVEVKDVAVIGQNGWSLTAMDSDFANMLVNTKKLGMSFNNLDATKEGLAATFGVIDADSEKAFKYDANLAPQSETIDKYEIASVVFTIGWYTGDNRIYEAVFENNSWDDIITACQNNEVPSTWAVGDTKTMTIGEQNIEVMIIGKNHDEYADGGIAPLTFQTVNVVERHTMNTEATDVGGWDGSEMYSYLNGDLLNSIEFKDSIKAVKKTTNIGKTDAGEGDITVETTNDKLFLLSSAEVFDLSDSTLEHYTKEGSQYAYYAAAEINTEEENSNAGKTLDGEMVNWWTRSPRASTNNYFRVVFDEGLLGNTEANDTVVGISFGFCF